MPKRLERSSDRASARAARSRLLRPRIAEGGLERGCSGFGSAASGVWTWVSLSAISADESLGVAPAARHASRGKGSQRKNNNPQTTKKQQQETTTRTGHPPTRIAGGIPSSRNVSALCG